MPRQALTKDHRGAVSVMFAGAAVPIIGMLGMAIDFSVLAEARSQLAMAADTAAIAGAKIASNDYINGDSANYATIGVAAAKTWFAAQIGGAYNAQTTLTTLGSRVTSNPPTVSITRNGVQFGVNVGYSGAVPTTFSAIFGVNHLNIAGATNATITVDAYVNIALLLDNSSSMLIGATTSDINTLQSITACSPQSTNSQQGTSAWTGPTTPLTCPTTYTATVSTPSPGAPVAGQAPKAAPCGFACHWSNNNQTHNSQPDYTQYDYYSLARNTSLGPITGFSNPTLRFDVVQSATANVISTMIQNEVLTDQFGISVFEFNSTLTRVYPTTGEASFNLVSALNNVVQITTPVVANNGDTDFPDSMTSLAAILTNAGDGSSSASPRKDLFIITDGIQDYGSRVVGNTEGPMSNAAAVTACNAIKAKGIGIFILYTPYTPLPYNPYYVSNIKQYVTGTPNAIVTALQGCASSPSGFYEADLPSQITSGLQVLLQSATSSPAHIQS